MGFWDWLWGGANFEEIIHGKIGDIIYPAYNGTNGWFKKSRWDLVTKIDKKGHIIIREFIWDYSTVRTLELLNILNKLK